jgi:hypothetical protein
MGADKNGAKNDTLARNLQKSGLIDEKRAAARDDRQHNRPWRFFDHNAMEDLWIAITWAKS